MNRITIGVAVGLILALIIVGTRTIRGERGPIADSPEESAPSGSAALHESRAEIGSKRSPANVATRKTDADDQPANPTHEALGDAGSANTMINMDDIPPGPTPSMDPGPPGTVEVMTNPAEVSVSQTVSDDPLSASSAAQSADPGPTGTEEVLADPAQ